MSTNYYLNHEFVEEYDVFDVDKYTNEDGELECTDATYKTLKELKSGEAVIDYYADMFMNFIDNLDFECNDSDTFDKVAIALSNIVYYLSYETRSQEIVDKLEKLNETGVDIEVFPALVNIALYLIDNDYDFNIEQVVTILRGVNFEDEELYGDFEYVEDALGELVINKIDEMSKSLNK